MLILRGSPALSAFRLQKLLGDLNSAGVPARAISTEFVHLVDLAADLTPAERAVLEKLLTYGPTRAAEKVVGLLQVVAPRPGTISPWSSKATDIAHICGLDAVKRIEASCLKEVVFTNSIPLSKEAKKCRRIKSLSIAGLLAEAIRSIHEETSVSVLFV